MLGADVLAGYFLTGRPPVPEEWAAVQRCLSALPPAPQPPPAPPAGAEPSWLRAWVDWGLATVLDRLGPATAARPPMPVPLPPPRCVPSAPRRRTAGPGQAGEGWVPWSLRMGRLASLALPGLDSVLHEAARSAPLALARGAARAVLRRDYATAARITRWLAWLEAEGAAPLVDASLLVREITLRGPEDSRCALDVAIARHLLERTNT
ncbi:hypothetical protein [Streptomyces sp. NPDC000134]|uniref:hypothetical protein n=1 Tax=Streptomyces sp. NPDC000134 TaxID=3364536 RepID=UPI0036C3F931